MANSELHQLPELVTPTNDDILYIVDSPATTRVASKVTKANLLAGLATGTGSATGTNTGDQTSIAGITGTLAQFNAACSDADFSTYRKLYNQSVAAQGPGFSTDTYLVGSAINVSGLKAGSRYHLVFDVSKTAAGLATPIMTVRFGTAGSVADAARLSFTFLAQTAVADIGTFEVWVTFRSVGAGVAAVLQGSSQVRHRLQITGLQNLVSTTLQVTSGGFDSTVANSIIGASVNAGASSAWTVQLAQAELENLL